MKTIVLPATLNVVVSVFDSFCANVTVAIKRVSIVNVFFMEFNRLMFHNRILGCELS